MTPKETFEEDIKGVFFNLDEFSETRKINGVEMQVQIDDIEQIKREKKMKQNMDGIYMNQKMIYVAAEDFGPLPKQGSLLTMDKRTFKVKEAIEEGGIYSITIEAARA